jgi:ubiquinone/menaquinone biosynthesis C-methylase UbiE
MVCFATGCSTDNNAETSPTSGATAENSVEDRDGHHSDHQDKAFTDPEERADDWNSPERDAWQHPEAVVDAMAIESGMTVADVGTGTGYFVPYLSKAVGDQGTVIAVDIQQQMLDYVDQMASDRGLTNVDTLLAEETDTNLKPNAVDRILIVNTWHHIPDRPDYARHLKRRLTDDGSVWIVDYRIGAEGGGPPDKHRLKPQQVADELEAGGLTARIPDSPTLGRQYIVTAHPRQ